MYIYIHTYIHTYIDLHTTVTAKSPYIYIQIHIHTCVSSDNVSVYMQSICRWVPVVPCVPAHQTVHRFDVNIYPESRLCMPCEEMSCDRC